MARFPFFVLLGALVGALFAPSCVARSPLRYADPFVGADSGATFPGAQVPFGFAAVGPDTVEPLGSGYRSGRDVLGFSLTHVSGVGGGGSKYGNFRLTPVTEHLTGTRVPSRPRSEFASPGYYTASLSNGVRVRGTATRLAGLLRFDFPGSGERNVLLDTTSAVDVAAGQFPLAAQTRVVGRNSVEGWVRMAGGFNGGPYKLFFALRFRRPFGAAGTFVGGGFQPAREARTGGQVRSGAWASFGRGAGSVEAGIALSFRGVEAARANLGRQVKDMSLPRVHRQAAQQWKDALERIRVRGGSLDQRRSFYSALYHAQLMPHDLTGENVWWGTRSPHYEDYYTLWDTFRTLHPLLLLIQPARQAAMVRSLVDTYRHTGWFPDARIAGKTGISQVGSSAAAVVGDAAVKGLRGVDYRKALRGLVKDAEQDSRAPLRYGRVLGDYKRLGYLNTASGKSASRTLEYAYDDFAVAQVARTLGRGSVARHYLQRSASWAHLWDPATRSIRPRDPSGAFESPHDLDRYYFAEPDASHSAPFYEGTARQWSTFVPHDVAGLALRLGGSAQLVHWLDELFDGGHYDASNEPDLLAPYLYIHAGRPDRTAERVRRILGTAYHASRAGLPGEDDSGALSSWFVWSAIGLFPNPAQPYYYVGSPLFSKTKIAVGPKRHFTIEAPGTSPDRRYVTAAELNGHPINRAWVMHKDVVRGGKLQLKMSSSPNSWGATQPPPH